MSYNNIWSTGGHSLENFLVSAWEAGVENLSRSSHETSLCKCYALCLSCCLFLKVHWYQKCVIIYGVSQVHEAIIKLLYWSTWGRLFYDYLLYTQIVSVRFYHSLRRSMLSNSYINIYFFYITNICLFIYIQSTKNF